VVRSKRVILIDGAGLHRARREREKEREREETRLRGWRAHTGVQEGGSRWMVAYEGVVVRGS